jgi:hypothetical protein
MLLALLGNRGEETADPAGVPSSQGAPAVVRDPAGPARGGTGSRARSPKATPGRASVSPDGTVEATKAPPEPTSAAGASGGIAGTADAPGDAAAVSAPDPTAAVVSAEQRTAPQGERKPSDVKAIPQPRERTPTPPDAGRGDRGLGVAARDDPHRRPLGRLRHDEGRRHRHPAAQRGPTVKAVVRLYEQNGKKRKSIIDATG